VCAQQQQSLEKVYCLNKSCLDTLLNNGVVLTPRRDSREWCQWYHCTMQV
jgi:hypothetical protein